MTTHEREYYLEKDAFEPLQRSNGLPVSEASDSMEC